MLDLPPALRIPLTALVVYFTLVVALRVLGKRTLSKWNAFDFAITVALGSVVASVVVSGSVGLLEGLAALSSLLLLQFGLTFVAVRVGWIDRSIKATPKLLLLRGEPCLETLRRERVPLSEVYAALRSNGVTDPGEVEAVVLETNGSFSVLRRQPGQALTTLRDVVGHPEADGQGREMEDQAVV